MIPTIIPTAYKAKTTASRGCVSSQATSSARLRPTGHFRIVDRTLDLRLRMDGSRGADDLIRYSDRTTRDARLEGPSFGIVALQVDRVSVATSVVGTKRTNRAGLMMSVDRGRSEVDQIFRLS
jgi:hypothetical protein